MRGARPSRPGSSRFAAKTGGTKTTRCTSCAPFALEVQAQDRTSVTGQTSVTGPPLPKERHPPQSPPTSAPPWRGTPCACSGRGRPAPSAPGSGWSGASSRTQPLEPLRAGSGERLSPPPTLLRPIGSSIEASLQPQTALPTAFALQAVAYPSRAARLSRKASPWTFRASRASPCIHRAPIRRALRQRSGTGFRAVPRCGWRCTTSSGGASPRWRAGSRRRGATKCGLMCPAGRAGRTLFGCRRRTLRQVALSLLSSNHSR